MKPQQFEYVARRTRRVNVDHGPDTFSFWKEVFWKCVVVPGLFVIACIAILIIMGLLKALGVKEL